MLHRTLLLLLLVSCAACAAPSMAASEDDSPVTEAKQKKHAAPNDVAKGDEPAAATSARRTTDLFVKTFGDESKPAIVFLHGGPGGNAFAFEGSIAQELASRGHFVVTYDQRGSGRSPKGSASDFTFAKVTKDLDDVIQSLELKSPVLIGHSWGGTLAVEYLELHPGVARGAVLVGNPMDYPDSIFNIQDRCFAAYNGLWGFVGDVEELRALRQRMFPQGFAPPFTFTNTDMLATMKHTMTCGLTFSSSPSLESVATMGELMAEDSDLLTAMEPAVSEGFQANEHLDYMNLTPLFTKHAKELFGIYGADDGLLSDAQNQRIASAIGPGHFVLVPNAGHMVYINQPLVFLDQLEKDIAGM